MREATTLPLAAGFGISTPEQAGAVAKMADGVVVGSAFVRLIENHASDAQIEAFARSLREGMERIDDTGRSTRRCSPNAGARSTRSTSNCAIC